MALFDVEVGETCAVSGNGYDGYPAVRTTSIRRTTTVYTAWYETHVSPIALIVSCGDAGRRN